MTSDNRRRYSRNLSVLLVILFFYIASSYTRVIAEFFSVRLNHWELAFFYWLVIGMVRRHWQFLATELFSLVAFGVVFTILQKVTFAISYADIFETTSARSLPVLILVFLVSPGIFFSFNFDPYGLVKELPRLVNTRATAHILLMLSAGEMFQARFAEVSDNLFVRGIDVRRGARRLLSIPTFLPPLLMALIQEAAYRHSYNSMLGCPADRFPVHDTRTVISRPQAASLIVAFVLIVVRLLI